MYEQTLLTDDSPFDRHFDDPGTSPFGEQELRGMAVFLGKGKCVNCHSTAMMTKASTLHLLDENAEEGLVERMEMAQGANGVMNPPALYDNGFYNIGVTPTVADIGRGGTDPFGNPLSFTRQYVDVLQGRDTVDPFEVNECTFETPFDVNNFLPINPDSMIGVTPVSCTTRDLPDTVRPVLAGTAGEADTNLLTRVDRRQFRVAVEGAMKVPTLRNVGVSAPYMHDGGMKNLAEVVEFYNRGGNVRGNFDFESLDEALGDKTACTQISGEDFENLGDTSGSGLIGACDSKPHQNRGSNLDPDIVPLGLTQQEKDDLVAFLLTATDDRLRCLKAPFDHPSLLIRNGATTVDSDGDGRADDKNVFLAAVGADGRPAEDLSCLPNTGDLFDLQTLIEEGTEQEYKPKGYKKPKKYRYGYGG